jgi:hypothetical protein
MESWNGALDWNPALHILVLQFILCLLTDIDSYSSCSLYSRRIHSVGEFHAPHAMNKIEQRRERTILHLWLIIQERRPTSYIPLYPHVQYVASSMSEGFPSDQSMDPSSISMVLTQPLKGGPDAEISGCSCRVGVARSRVNLTRIWVDVSIREPQLYEITGQEWTLVQVLISSLGWSWTFWWMYLYRI